MRYTLSLVALLFCIGAISPAYAACPPGIFCSFLYSGGTYTELTPAVAPSPFSVASGIDNKGQIVGYSGGYLGGDGFLYSRGAYHTLNYPGSETALYGINDRGQIVGQNATAGLGFEYSHHTFTTIKSPRQLFQHQLLGSIITVKSSANTIPPDHHWPFCIAMAATPTSVALQGAVMPMLSALTMPATSAVGTAAAALATRSVMCTAMVITRRSMFPAVLLPKLSASTIWTRLSVCMLTRAKASF